jgi:hypothetical protein
MSCEFCKDPDDSECCFPTYGVAPHTHDMSKTGSVIGSTVILPESEWPDNFEPDKDVPGCGTYTHCPKCGAGKRNSDD